MNLPNSKKCNNKTEFLYKNIFLLRMRPARFKKIICGPLLIIIINN